MTIAGATYREGVALSPDGAVYVTPTGTASITGGTITGTNTRYSLLKGGLPLVNVATGSMANNGAITVGTALPAIYAKCYLYLPAGAIAAGVPAAAAWLYAEMTSTTLGTVYNNSFDPNLGATPTAPAKVAFATTGPGAYAGVTAEITNVQAAIPAAAMGVVGQLQQSCVYSVNNTAGAKTCRLKFGGSSYAAPDGANGTIVWSRGTVTNAGESGRQVTEGQNVVGNTSGNTGPNELTIDTSAATTCAVSTQKAVATDNIILRVYAFDLIL